MSETSPEPVLTDAEMQRGYMLFARPISQQSQPIVLHAGPLY